MTRAISGCIVPHTSAETGKMPNPNISITPVDRCSDEGLEALVTASQDPHIVAMSYHPAGLTKETAREWVKTQGPLAWLINLEGTPVGFYRTGPVLSACGLKLPPDTCESEAWLLPDARGKGLIPAVTELVKPKLVAAGVKHIVAPVWETNTASNKSVKGAGFKWIGRGMWEHPDYDFSGVCEMWILTLSSD